LLEGSVLSPFLFTLVFTLIWEFFPPPRFPSHQTFLFRWVSIWVIAFADDLAIASASSVRLTRCLTKLKTILQRLWLAISLKKTEVVTFTSAGQRRPRRGLPVRVGRDIVPPAQSFKYLGVTISSQGRLTVHERAVASKAKVSGFEVAKLMRRLGVRDVKRLRAYMQCFVDSQFYGLELFPLHMSQSIDASRKTFLCTLFNLPCCTAKNLVYAILPAMPSVYLMLKRRAAFYARAQIHDLECVREAFLFDMCQLYPNPISWTFQLAQIFHAIGVDASSDISCFPRHLREFDETMTDPELICFHCVRLTDEKNLIFFSIVPRCDDGCLLSRFFIFSESSRAGFSVALSLIGSSLALFCHVGTRQLMSMLRCALLVMGAFSVLPTVPGQC
jgi:hypothetical protein